MSKVGVVEGLHHVKDRHLLLIWTIHLMTTLWNGIGRYYMRFGPWLALLQYLVFHDISQKMAERASEPWTRVVATTF